MIHKELASSCFNKVWEHLDNPNRTASESEQMVHLCHSSFWHWTQVEGHTQTNLSVGYWQLARVYAVIGQGRQALEYADKCLAVSLDAGLEPFYIAYAYEAAARAYAALDEQEKKSNAAAQANRYAEQITEEEHKGWVVRDLGTI
ncbi:hypothetical protein [Paenibacillus sp. R14(2021)]|uniref:hypothetical protein n=1 Tax=Paenibacillus sp. R14(2021) TaxID=2859228 RepID=UPI001C6123EB|nr:hypothetical protein [Paenibacillus sp. R14(2021)]